MFSTCQSPPVKNYFTSQKAPCYHYLSSHIQPRPQLAKSSLQLSEVRHHQLRRFSPLACAKNTQTSISRKSAPVLVTAFKAWVRRHSSRSISSVAHFEDSSFPLPFELATCSYPSAAIESHFPYPSSKVQPTSTVDIVSCLLTFITMSTDDLDATYHSVELP